MASEDMERAARPELKPQDLSKYAAAAAAVDEVRDGMRLGLGSGSTAIWMVRCLAARVRQEGLHVICAATSEGTASAARSLGLEVTGIDEIGRIDLTIDGADEIDPKLNLIKGGGAAHLREMIVAAASDRMLVVADPGKLVAELGGFPLPVEVVRFGTGQTIRTIEALLADWPEPAEAVLRRRDGAPLVTDNGNHIVDLHLRRIAEPAELAADLRAIPGVVETGLFLGRAEAALIGHPEGRVERRNDRDEMDAAWRRFDPGLAETLPEPDPQG